MASSNIMPSSPVKQERTNLLSDVDDLLHYSKKVTGKPHSGAKYWGTLGTLRYDNDL